MEAVDTQRPHAATVCETYARTLSVEQAGALLGISRGLAYAAVNSGAIPSVRIGRRILVPVAQLSRLLGEELSLDARDDDGSVAAEPPVPTPAAEARAHEPE